ncbi:hypothetical protein AB0I81_23485 [Nonomuraea sp. NPDC050404]|uniref:hypothetical protein n=1 Tax=Nonomuraea sp. NPDC050404 TaxID=3155783 RepID=UPI0033D6F79A
MIRRTRRSVVVGVALLLCAAVAAGACSRPDGGDGTPGPSASEIKETEMLVEVDLYSGRPNPTFVLGEDETGEFRRRVGALPVAPGSPSPREGLGYRGLTVSSGPGAQPEAMISDGTVVVHRADGTEQWLADRGRALERWLLETGAATLPAEVMAVVREDLGR